MLRMRRENSRRRRNATLLSRGVECACPQTLFDLCIRLLSIARPGFDPFLETPPTVNFKNAISEKVYAQWACWVGALQNLESTRKGERDGRDRDGCTAAGLPASESVKELQ